jgi:hypothetical protein
MVCQTGNFLDLLKTVELAADLVFHLVVRVPLLILEVRVSVCICVGLYIRVKVTVAVLCHVSTVVVVPSRQFLSSYQAGHVHLVNFM